MAEEMVSIGCRLPNGLHLEVGFSVNDKGNGGAPFAMVRKHDNYQSFTLKGTNQALIVRDASRKPVAVLPNSRNREAYINQVPKAFWEEWLKRNAKSWHVTSGQIFEVPKLDASTVKAAALDAAGKSAPIFEALDQGATMKIDDHAITRLPRDDE